MAEATTAVRVPAGGVALDGDLGVPDAAAGAVLFAHGSGSGRHSPRNRHVADRLRQAGLATLLVDLLTPDEQAADAPAGRLRFDIPLLADRLEAAVEWLVAHPPTTGLRVGLFGASTGGGAAARQPGKVAAVVSRGGRPDLAADALPAALCPTLLIVGGADPDVASLNAAALARLGAPVKELAVVPGAGHLFDGPGQLGRVADLAADWFVRHLGPGGGPYAG